MDKSLQLFSERCSGSNFLSKLIELNFTGLEFNQPLGGKHWIPKKTVNSTMDIRIIILTRSIFDWVRSIHRNPWHCHPEVKKLPFSGFIRAEWHCVYNSEAGIDEKHKLWKKEIPMERNPTTNERFHNLIEMRGVKHQYWINYGQIYKNVLIIKYEDLADNPSEELQKIADFLNVEVNSKVVVPKAYKGNASWKRELLLKLTFNRIGCYKPKPRQPLSIDDIEFIHRQSDHEVEALLGYDLEALVKLETLLNKNAC